MRLIQIKKLLLRSGSRGRLWAKVSNSHSSSSSRPSTGEREGDSVRRNYSLDFRFCQINTRLPPSIALDQEQGPLSGLAGQWRAKDPNASEFRSEYDGISRTCMAFQSKNSGVSRPRAKDLAASRDEHSAWMRRCPGSKTRSGLPVSIRSGRTARFT